MKRFFTYLFSALLISLCISSYEVIPENLSYKLLSPTKREALKEKKELYTEMKTLIDNGSVKIELYDPSGQLVDIIEKPDDFTKDLEVLFSVEDLSIRTTTSVAQLSSPTF